MISKTKTFFGCPFFEMPVLYTKQAFYKCKNRKCLFIYKTGIFYIFEKVAMYIFWAEKFKFFDLKIILEKKFLLQHKNNQQSLTQKHWRQSNTAESFKW